MVKFRGAPVFLAWFCLIFGLIYYGVGSIFLSAYAVELRSVSTGLQVLSWFIFRGLAIVLALWGMIFVFREKIEVTRTEVRFFRYGKLCYVLPADAVKLYGMVSFGPRTTRIFFSGTDDAITFAADYKKWSRLRRKNALLIATEDTSNKGLVQVWKLWNKAPVLAGTLAGNRSLERDLRVLYEKQN